MCLPVCLVCVWQVCRWWGWLRYMLARARACLFAWLLACVYVFCRRVRFRRMCVCMARGPMQSVCLCLSACLCVALSRFAPSVCLSGCCLSVCLRACLPACLSVVFSTVLSVRIPGMSVRLSVLCVMRACLLACLRACLRAHHVSLDL